MISQTSEKSRNSSDLILSNPLADRLTAIFSHNWQFLLREADEWRTETRYALRPAALWQLWKDAQTFIGVRFGQLTRYGLIDIDIESPYHPKQNPAAVPSIVQSLESIGIYRVLILRSSDSGGIHIYVPLETPIATYGLATALKFCCEDAGFKLAPGKLEIFPNCKAYKANDFTNYNGHRLPLQTGSYLLNDDYQPITNDLGFFLKVWDMSAAGNNNQELEATIALNKKRPGTHTKGGKSKGQQWQLDCEAAIAAGWTAHGQTNELLGTFAQYGRVFLALSGDELVQWMISTAIAAPGYKEWCRHKHQIERRCKEWAKDTEGYYFPYPSSQPRTKKSPWKSNKNDEKSSNAVERIKDAYESLKNSAYETQTELLNAIATIAKCSLSTLYKNRSIWQPQIIDDPECVITENPYTETDREDQTENTPNTPKPLPDKELHTIAPKKVLIPASESDRTSEKTNLNSKTQTVESPATPPGFDFGDRASPTDAQNHSLESDSGDSSGFSTDRGKESLNSVDRSGCRVCCFEFDRLGCELEIAIGACPKNGSLSGGHSTCSNTNADLARHFLKGDRCGEIIQIHFIE